MTDSSLPQSSSDGAKAASVPTLDVFALRDSVVDEYKRFAKSFTTIRAQDIREQVAAIYAEDRYWPEPLIQINPSYRRSTDVGALVANGVLHPGCGDIFRADGQPLSLYKHQEQAIALAAEWESFVVTTGTGVREVAVFLHPHRQPCAGGTAGERAAAHAGGCRLPDERACELPDGGAEQVYRSGAWRSANHVRPLHGAGRHGPAEAGGRRSAGHTSYQLHDA